MTETQTAQQNVEKFVEYEKKYMDAQGEQDPEIRGRIKRASGTGRKSRASRSFNPMPDSPGDQRAHSLNSSGK